MTMPQPVKNSSVNQSIKAAMLRRSVGSANAASVANAGRASSSVRSAGLVVTVAAIVTTANHSGRTRCRLTGTMASWRRQRHTVHNTSGQAGQVNHSSRRARLRQSLLPASWDSSTRHCHRSSDDARAAASTVSSAITPALRKARRRPAGPGSAARKCSSAAPAPNRMARLGAALSTRPASPHASALAGAHRRWPMAAMP